MKTIMLILMSLVVMVGVGSLQNIMVTDGYSASVNLTCPGWPDITCNNTSNVGCQSAPAQCTLSGTSISFLNGNSPFTQLLRGNILGFFTGLTNAGIGTEGGRGPFDNLGGGSFYNVDCIVTQNIDGHQTNAAVGKCTQTNTDGSNMTENQVVSWANWNVNQTGLPAVNLQLYRLGNGSFPMTCAWDAQINSTLLANGPGWTYFGCDSSQGALNISGSRIWSMLIAMPVSSGGISAGSHHWKLFIKLMNSDFDNGNGPQLSSSAFFNNQYQNWWQTFKGILISGSPFSNQYFVPGVNGPVLAFLFGFVLLIIGIGLNFSLNGTFFGTGGGFGAGINQQGTRLAQSLGIGLLVFSPLYSEFGGWFTSGNALDVLPNGVDFFMLILITGAFFFGVFWTAMSWE